MRILALEPFYGGSHRAFLDRWREGSRHRFTLLTLPPYKWKWRMRHGAVTFAEEVRRRCAAGDGWDLLFASDMLDLATFRGLAPAAVASLPAVAYFHENQLTYPVREEAEQDLHFAFTNLTTALAADEVWWNSDFHRRELLEALPRLLERMPDHRPTEAVEELRGRSRIYPQGVDDDLFRVRREPGRGRPLRILWAARWEHDKDPESFFRALGIAAERGVDFRLNVIGESFREQPPVFADARRRFADRIDRWGFQESRGEYLRALAESEVVVSTARHEFFGVSVVEAIAAGCRPLLPERLAYPELLAEVPAPRRGDFFYDGTPRALADRLAELADAHRRGELGGEDPGAARRAVARFAWGRLRPRLDEAVERVATPPPP